LPSTASVETAHGFDLRDGQFIMDRGFQHLGSVMQNAG
jgi:hypothetical protein